MSKKHKIHLMKDTGFINTEESVCGSSFIYTFEDRNLQVGGLRVELEIFIKPLKEGKFNLVCRRCLKNILNNNKEDLNYFLTDSELGMLYLYLIN